MAKIRITASNLTGDSADFTVTAWKNKSSMDEQEELFDETIDAGKTKTKRVKPDDEPKKFTKIDAESESVEVETDGPIKSIKAVLNGEGKLEVAVQDKAAKMYS